MCLDASLIIFFLFLFKDLSSILFSLAMGVISGIEMSLNKLSNMKNQEINELLKNKHVFPIELGRSIGWESYLGRLTKTFSIDSFGESAPIEDLEKNFGFDVPSITKEIIKYLN